MQEGFHFVAQFIGFGIQSGDGGRHLTGCRAGFIGAVGHIDNIGCDILGAGSCLFDITGNFPGRCTLFFDGSSNTRGDFIDLADNTRNALDGVD